MLLYILLASVAYTTRAQPNVNPLQVNIAIIAIYIGLNWGNRDDIVIVIAIY